jgi:hypothetical protein
MSQLYPIFVVACKEKIYGPKIWVNLNNVTSFEKSVKLLPDEQWYLVKTTDGSSYYTTYDCSILSIFNDLPN